MNKQNPQGAHHNYQGQGQGMDSKTAPHSKKKKPRKKSAKSQQLPAPQQRCGNRGCMEINYTAASQCKKCGFLFKGNKKSKSWGQKKADRVKILEEEKLEFKKEISELKSKLASKEAPEAVATRTRSAVTRQSKRQSARVKILEEENSELKSKLASKDMVSDFSSAFVKSVSIGRLVEGSTFYDVVKEPDDWELLYICADGTIKIENCWYLIDEGEWRIRHDGTMTKENAYRGGKTTAEVLRDVKADVEDDLLEATEGTVRDALNTEFDEHQMTLLFDGNKVDLDQPVAELELTAENVENLQVVRAQQGDDDSSDDDKVGDFRLSFDSDDVNIDDV